MIKEKRNKVIEKNVRIKEDFFVSEIRLVLQG
jgi:hypothetical protein